MAATQQFYNRYTITSTAAVAIALGFVAKEHGVRNNHGSLPLYIRWDGTTATSTNAWPLNAGQFIQIRNAPSSVFSAISTATSTAAITLDVFGLQ